MDLYGSAPAGGSNPLMGLGCIYLGSCRSTPPTNKRLIGKRWIDEAIPNVDKGGTVPGQRLLIPKTAQVPRDFPSVLDKTAVMRAVASRPRTTASNSLVII